MLQTAHAFILRIDANNAAAITLRLNVRNQADENNHQSDKFYGYRQHIDLHNSDTYTSGN